MMEGRRERGDAQGQDAAIADWLRRGDGHGQAYAPWLTVQRVPTRGQANRIHGRASGREHHLLSDLEAQCLYALDWLDDVTDVREQYPLLPLEATLTIAAELGVSPPAHPRLGYPIVMTTDFLVTREGPFGAIHEAIAVKPSSALADERTLAKLEIERRYWAARSSRWNLVTERELPHALIHNLRWFAPVRALGDFHMTAHEVSLLINDLYVRLDRATEPLTRVCRQADEHLGLRLGTSLTLARHALATKRWRTDLAIRIDPDKPLHPLSRGDGAMTMQPKEE